MEQYILFCTSYYRWQHCLLYLELQQKCLYQNHNVMNMKRIVYINFIQIHSWHQIIISSKYIESCCVISLPKYHSEPQTGLDRSDACSIGPTPVRFWHFNGLNPSWKHNLQTHVMIFSGNITVAGVEGSILLPNDLAPTESTPAKAAVRAGRYSMSNLTLNLRSYVRNTSRIHWILYAHCLSMCILSDYTYNFHNTFEIYWAVHQHKRNKSQILWLNNTIVCICPCKQKKKTHFNNGFAISKRRLSTWILIVSTSPK